MEPYQKLDQNVQTHYSQRQVITVNQSLVTMTSCKQYRCNEFKSQTPES